MSLVNPAALLFAALAVPVVAFTSSRFGCAACRSRP